MLKPKLINKKLHKLVAGCCKICKADIYDILDVHRIVPGEQGGKYTEFNTVVICSNCHRKVHAGTIVIDRWYSSTAGKLLRVIIDGQESFL